MKLFLTVLVGFFVFTIELESEKAETQVLETTTTRVNPKDIINHETSTASSPPPPAKNESDSLFHEVEGIAKRVFELTFQGLMGIVTRISHIILDEKPVNFTTTAATTLNPSDKQPKDFETLVHENGGDNGLIGADFPLAEENSTSYPPHTTQNENVKH